MNTKFIEIGSIGVLDRPTDPNSLIGRLLGSYSFIGTQPIDVNMEMKELVRKFGLSNSQIDSGIQYFADHLFWPVLMYGAGVIKGPLPDLSGSFEYFYDEGAKIFANRVIRNSNISMKSKDGKDFLIRDGARCRISFNLNDDSDSMLNWSVRIKLKTSNKENYDLAQTFMGLIRSDAEALSNELLEYRDEGGQSVFELRCNELFEQMQLHPEDSPSMNLNVQDSPPLNLENLYRHIQ